MDNDLIGYEVLIDFIRERWLHQMEGDMIEIGALMGGGTVKLARFAHEYGKLVYSVDVFDPGFDQTEDIQGNKMCDIYHAFLDGRSQMEVYQETISGFDNIVTIKEDSKKVKFSGDQKLIFGFIDGNHDPEYVRNDFHIVWPNLVPGGVLGFHDYGGELPQVTGAVDRLLDEQSDSIEEVHHIKEKDIILLVKKT